MMGYPTRVELAYRRPPRPDGIREIVTKGGQKGPPRITESRPNDDSCLLFLGFLVGGLRVAFLFALLLAFLGVFLCFRLLSFALLAFSLLLGRGFALLRFSFT